MKKVFTHSGYQNIWDTTGAACRTHKCGRYARLGIILLLFLTGTYQNGWTQVTDTDGDGIDDLTEIADGTNPSDPCDPDDTAGTCCTYQGSTINFGTSDGNADEQHTDVFILTAPDGTITAIADESMFTAVAPGLYYIYAINYRIEDGISGLDIGANIAGLNSNCMDMSAPLIVHSCGGDGGVQLAAKVYLQAVYENVSQLMRDDLRVAGHIPNVEPYTEQERFEHVNNSRQEQIPSTAFTVIGKDAIVDWVFLELRDPQDPARVVSTRSALLQRDGDIVDLDGISPVLFDQPLGDYHVAVRHRNHLGTMTLDVQSATEAPIVVDFTDINLPVWGEHARKIEGGVAQLWGGNTTIDDFLIFQGAMNDVDPVFFNVILSDDNTESITNYIVEGYLNTDTDMDGRTIYQGVNNDLDQLIFFNVLAHPSNTNTIVNYIIVEQLPK